MGLYSIKRQFSREIGLWYRAALYLNDLPSASKVTTREVADKIDADYDQVMGLLSEFERLNWVAKLRLPNGGLGWVVTNWLPPVGMEEPDDAAFARAMLMAGQFLGSR